MATVSPRQRTVEATYRITDKAVVQGAEPLLCHRTKRTHFLPREITVEMVVTPDGLGEATRVFITGWVLKDGKPQVGRPGRAFFNTPTDRVHQPAWVGDYLERLWKDVEATHLNPVKASTESDRHA